MVSLVAEPSSLTSGISPGSERLLFICWDAICFELMLILQRFCEVATGLCLFICLWNCFWRLPHRGHSGSNNSFVYNWGTDFGLGSNMSSEWKKNIYSGQEKCFSSKWVQDSSLILSDTFLGPISRTAKIFRSSIARIPFSNCWPDRRCQSISGDSASSFGSLGFILLTFELHLEWMYYLGSVLDSILILTSEFVRW